MPKYHRIRWSEQDTQQISKVVKNFNAKVNRLAKQNPDIASILPEKVSVKQLKELINTRQDLNRELNALKRFSKRGSEKIVDVPNSEYGLKITLWQRSEMNRRIGIINRKRKARLNELEQTEMKSRGESLGYTRGQLGMGKASEIALKPMTAFFRTMGKKDLSKRWKSILVQSQSDYFTKQDFLVRENYIKGLKLNYNETEIEDIIDEIENMDIKDFLNIFEQEGGTFEFLYPSSELEQEYINSLRATWNVKNQRNSSKQIISDEFFK